MPLYLLVFGLRMRQAVGTSLLVISALSIPTLTTHWALGHIDWGVAVAFTVGVVPASFAGAHFSRRLGVGVQRRAFGIFLIAFGTAFTLYRILS